MLESYEKILARDRLIDHADAMRLAAARLRDAPPRGGRVILLPDDLRLTKLEERLVEALAGDRIVRLPVDRSEVFAEGSVRIVAAVGEVNEVREALRGCLAAPEPGLPLDHLEILYTAPEPYVPLLYDTAQRVLGFDSNDDLGVPVTFADGVPARLSRPGRLLVAWLSWIHEGFGQSTLLGILQTGLLGGVLDEEGESIGPARLVRALRATGIGFGRERYVRRIEERIAGLTRQLDGRAAGADTDPGEWDRQRLDRQLRNARGLLKVVEPLISVSPPLGTAPVRVVEAAAALLRDRARVASALDGLALQHLLQEIDPMAEALAGAPSGPQGDAALAFDAWEWLAELPDRLRVGGSGPRPGHLHIAPVGAGGHTGRPHTIILGLNDGRFPPGGRQDPLLLDGERQRLSRALATSTSRLHEQLDDFGRLLARLRGRVTLSYSSRNITDDSEMFAGPIVLSAYRIISGKSDGDHTALREWLGPPASFAPQRIEACLDSSEWWHCHGADGSVGNLGELLETSFPHLGRGREAAEARASDGFTVWDGRVREPAPALDPRHDDGPVLSATSSLADLGRCPLAYFQRFVLRIRPPQDVAVDPQRWLDHKDFGSLMHEILYEFVGLLLEEGSWPTQPARDHPRVAAIVDARTEARRRDVPPPTEEVYERQCRELGRAAEIFVNEQAIQAAGGRPVYLEATIGLPSEARRTDIDAPEPVVLELRPGATIRARARIDRIDRLDDPRPDGQQQPGGPRFTIWDYKSGSYVKSWDPSDNFGRGRLLQHVLYMAVTESVLRAQFGADARVEKFTFLFPGVRTHGRAVSFPAAIVGEGLEMIDRLCRLPAAGAFPATNDVEDCKFCDYRNACRAVYRDLKDLCASSARKLANRQNTALAPFVELRVDS